MAAITNANQCRQ